MRLFAVCEEHGEGNILKIFGYDYQPHVKEIAARSKFGLF
jgi:hypothetical protein